MSGFGLKRVKASPIALDFGAGALKAMQVVPGSAVRLVDAAILETPAELLDDPMARLAFQFEHLPDLLKGREFIGKRASCSVSASQTLVQHVQTPVDGGDSAKASIEAVANSLGCAASQLVARSLDVTTVVRGSQKRRESVCLAIPRAVVDRYMSALRDAKLKPVGIHAEHIATVHAFDHMNRRDGDENITHLYLDLGATTTKIMIAHGKALVLAKTLDLSARPAVGPAVHKAPKGIVEAVLVEMSAPDETGEFAMGLASASEERRDAATPPGITELVTDVRASGGHHDRVLDELIDEVRTAVRYHSALFPGREIDHLIFLGGCSSDVSICQRVAQALHLPAQLADPLASIVRQPGAHLPMDCSSPLPGWALAFGLTQAPCED